MSIFKAGNFKSLYESPDGQRAWKFLNRPESKHAMEVATDLRRPAVEPLDRELVVLFPFLRKENKVTETERERKARDRFKQMLGAMARQIMEESGFRVDRNGVEINASNLVFSTATRYARTEHRV